jgi:hypothetical protein
VANNIAFQAKGKTYQANATTTSQRINILADGPCNQLLVANHETATKAVYFRIGDANVTVAAPTAGNAQYALLSLPGQYKVFTVPQQFTVTGGLWIAFICEVGTAECYFTPGEGF